MGTEGKRWNLFSNNVDNTVGIGPEKTMIEHECPYWSPLTTHMLCWETSISQDTLSIRRSNKPNETLHVDSANQGEGVPFISPC